jgi:hypothetical protein
MPEFRLIFCSDPIDPREPDAAFSAEVDAARSSGLKFLRIDHEALDHAHDAKKAIGRIEAEGPVMAVYRGWMLRSDDYRRLYQALANIGVVPLNTPEQYATCHHLPEAYPYIAPWSAASTWVDRALIQDWDAISVAVAKFGSRPIVLKDWVKSQAVGYWAEACFIPDASDQKIVMRVISRFLDIQGESLVGGLVFRKYLPLATAGGESQEWRAFILDGELLGCWPRFRATAEHQPPPDELLNQVARSLPTRFAAADFALSDGQWFVIEVGDGQVSGFPNGAPVTDIFSALAKLGQRVV